MPTLYVVATPIGNLSDMTFRAVDILKSSNLVICEDTRRSKILFDHYDIKSPRVSYHAQSSDAKLSELVEKIKESKTVSYITDAGTPGISDPGMKLVREAIKGGINVLPVPGASAMTSLMSVSGSPSSPMVWLGFLPHKKGRQTILKNINENPKSAFLFYESVHRIEKLLREMNEAEMGDRQIVIGREMTKAHEEFIRGTVTQVQAKIENKEMMVKGEFAVYVAPASFMP